MLGEKTGSEWASGRSKIIEVQIQAAQLRAVREIFHSYHTSPSPSFFISTVRGIGFVRLRMYNLVGKCREAYSDSED
jgi:hypothetical protein